MAHYARVINSQVIDVIVADEAFIQLGIIGDPSEFIQTSYNTGNGIHYGQDGQPDGGIPLRKNYAGIGYTYDIGRDAFIPPKPFESWVLDEETCNWKAPIIYPSDGQDYVWDEEFNIWKPAIIT